MLTWRHPDDVAIRMQRPCIVYRGEYAALLHHQNHLSLVLGGATRCGRLEHHYGFLAAKRMQEHARRHAAHVKFVHVLPERVQVQLLVFLRLIALNHEKVLTLVHIGCVHERLQVLSFAQVDAPVVVAVTILILVRLYAKPLLYSLTRLLKAFFFKCMLSLF